MKKSLLVLMSTAALLGAEGLTLSSGDMTGQMTKANEFDGFGCSGKNVSPALRWSGAPTGTKSFALTMYDPDAPTGSGWWHWIAFNIPKTTTSLPAGAGSGGTMPKGSVQAQNDYGAVGFGGACPPVGDKPHMYITTVYALDIDKLPIGADVNAPVAGYMINAHTLQKSTIVTYYGR